VVARRLAVRVSISPEGEAGSARMQVTQADGSFPVELSQLSFVLSLEQEAPEDFSHGTIALLDRTRTFPFRSNAELFDMMYGWLSRQADQ
jgi:hypothetical protein